MIRYVVATIVVALFPLAASANTELKFANGVVIALGSNGELKVGGDLTVGSATCSL